MATSQVKALDYLPGPMIDGTFCASNDEMFAVVSFTMRRHEVLGTTIRVYDLSGLKGAMPLEGESIAKLPLRWEADTPDLYQSVTYVDGKLLLGGLCSVAELDAEAGVVTSAFDGKEPKLVWPEEVKFQEPIFPPLLHNGMVIVLSHNGSVYKFARRTPPTGPLRPFFAVGGWRLPEPEPEREPEPPEAPPSDPPHGYPQPGVYEEELPPPRVLTWAERFISQGSVRQPGTLVGNRLMFQHENRIVVVDVETNKLVAESPLDKVRCDDKTLDLSRMSVLRLVHTDQAIVDLNGFGFLPFKMPMDWRLDEDRFFQSALQPILYAKDPEDGSFLWTHGTRYLVMGLLIAPDGGISIPLTRPSGSDAPVIYPLRLVSTPSLNYDPLTLDFYVDTDAPIEALPCVGTVTKQLLFHRELLPNLEVGIVRGFHGFEERGDKWAYLRSDEDGVVSYARNSAHLEESLHTSTAFWAFNPKTAIFEQIQIVATSSALKGKVINNCEKPDLHSRDVLNTATAIFVRGATGRTMAFNEVNHDFYPFASGLNKLLLLPE